MYHRTRSIVIHEPIRKRASCDEPSRLINVCNAWRGVGERGTTGGTTRDWVTLQVADGGALGLPVAFGYRAMSTPNGSMSKKAIR